MSNPLQILNQRRRRKAEELRLQQDSEDKKRYSDISPQKGDTGPHATDGPLQGGKMWSSSLYQTAGVMSSWK